MLGRSWVTVATGMAMKSQSAFPMIALNVF
jgi:hypothetical protein